MINLLKNCIRFAGPFLLSFIFLSQLAFSDVNGYMVLTGGEHRASGPLFRSGVKNALGLSAGLNTFELNKSSYLEISGDYFSSSSKSHNKQGEFSPYINDSNLNVSVLGYTVGVCLFAHLPFNLCPYLGLKDISIDNNESSLNYGGALSLGAKAKWKLNVIENDRLFLLAQFESLRTRFKYRGESTNISLDFRLLGIGFSF